MKTTEHKPVGGVKEILNMVGSGREPEKRSPNASVAQKIEKRGPRRHPPPLYKKTQGTHRLAGFVRSWHCAGGATPHQHSTMVVVTHRLIRSVPRRRPRSRLLLHRQIYHHGKTRTHPPPDIDSTEQCPPEVKRKQTNSHEHGNTLTQTNPSLDHAQKKIKEVHCRPVLL